jgi:hypothetical protein
MRYRDMEHVDLDAARRSVSTWLNEHPSRSLAEMADELKKNYPAFPDEMAIVLRGMMAAELRRRTSPSVLPHIPLQVVDSDVSPRRDSVSRLHRFQRDHIEVQFASPSMGPYSQYTALIPAETIPGENREIIVKSPDLCGLMDQLDDLFTAPPNPD